MTRAYAHVFALMTVVGVRLEDHFENRKDRGATAVEYGLLVGLIAVVLIVAVTAFGGSLRDLFNNVEGRIPTGL